MEKILFSPLGDTDPVRGFRDGACLHIIRHYRPELVELFYTADMEDKKKKDDRFVRAIKRLAPEMEIRENFSHITEPHIYDNFIGIFQERLEKLHAEYPEAEILLNLSSGTPQMKTMLALLSVEEAWCRGVQVASPEGASNRNNYAAGKDDIDELLELNEDDSPDSPNRCLEPPLRAFRINNEKQRFDSLLKNYEYKNALTLLQHSVLKSKEAEKLLKYADARRDFRLAEAMEYGGIRYFPFQKDKRITMATKLAEYFLRIQMEQQKGNLELMLLKSIPFMYTLLREYVKQNPAARLEAFCERDKISRSAMHREMPKLEKLFDDNCRHFDGADLSFFHLQLICRYLQQEGLAADKGKNDGLLAEISKIEGYRPLRNKIAHELGYVDEELFQQQVTIGSRDFVSSLYRMFKLLYGDNLRRDTYEKINGLIAGALDKEGKK